MTLTTARAPADRTISSDGKTGAMLPVVVRTMAIVNLIIAFAALLSAVSAEPGGPDRQFGAPGSGPRGLAWDGTHLWMVDDDEDAIYKLDAERGTVLESFPAPGPDSRGLAWDGAHLWTSDNSTLEIYKLDPEGGTVLGTLDAPVTRDGGTVPELGGLAWDGERLWCGTIAGWSSKMIEVDPTDGTRGRSYFTKGYPRALESDGTFIWNATDNSGRRSGIVYKYRLSDGMYVSQFDTPFMFPTALALEGRHLWCADFETKAVHRLAAE
jgi:outer membrane protein assembly factor BamB